MAFKLVMMPPQSEVTPGWLSRLEAAVPGIAVVAPATDEEARREIVDADAAYGAVPAAALAVAEKLRWLHSALAGPPAGYYSPELLAHPVVVTNPRGIFSDHIGVQIMTFVLAFARGLHIYFPQQFAHQWNPQPRDATTVYLPESLAVIVGVGGIGAEAARLCALFGMRVLGVDPRREDAPEGVAALHRPEALDRLLPDADFVILTAPHTPQTEGMIDAARLGRMKRGAFLINIGRGATVRLDDLNQALRAGEIGSAALDVFEIEPLPPDHPLWSAPNVILTPHVAWHGPFLDERRIDLLIDNCRRFDAGEPLRNVVDKANWF